MSNNLNLSQVAANQDQKEVTINDQVGQIDAAITEILSTSVASGNVTLTSAQFRGACKFIGTGHTVARDLTFPAIERAFFIVQNDGTSSGTLNVVVGSTSLSLAVGEIGHYSTDGTTNGLNRVGGELGSSNPFDVGMFVGGLPDNSELVLYLPMVRTVVFPAGLTGSYALANVASTGTKVFDIQKNGGSVGSATFTTSATGVLAMASQQTFAAGDILSIVAPAAQDATLSDIGFNLKGTR